MELKVGMRVKVKEEIQEILLSLNSEYNKFLSLLGIEEVNCNFEDIDFTGTIANIADGDALVDFGEEFNGCGVNGEGNGNCFIMEIEDLEQIEEESCKKEAKEAPIYKVFFSLVVEDGTVKIASQINKDTFGESMEYNKDIHDEMIKVVTNDIEGFCLAHSSFKKLEKLLGELN